MSSKRFVIWSAVSSEEQAERYSLTEQTELAQQHVTRWGGDVVDTLTVGESRSIVLFEDACRKIPAYNMLKSYIERRLFDVLICYDTTRLGRKRSLIMTILELCAEAGVTVYEIDNPPSTLDGLQTYDRRILDAIKSTSAQQEIDKLKARFAYGRLGRLKRGDMPRGVPPYGYTIVVTMEGTATKRTVVVDEERAAVVRGIIDAYLAGSGFSAIATALNNAGTPSPHGVLWTHTLVGDVLRRVWRYAGYTELGMRKSTKTPYTKAQGNWTPIIDVATADRVIAERAARNSNRRISNTRGNLTGCVWCASCNRQMWQMFRTPTNRSARFYCPGHNGSGVPTERILEACHIAVDVLAGADLSGVADDTAQVDALQAHIAQHTAAVERHHVAMRRADTAFVSGVMDEERYMEQVKRLRAAIDAEQGAIAQLRTDIISEQARGSRRDRLTDMIANGHAYLDSPDTATANAWLRPRMRVLCADGVITDVMFL